MSFPMSACHPLSLTRRVEDYPIGNVPLCEHQRCVVAGAPVAWHGCAWLDPEEFAGWRASGLACMVDAGGNRLAWRCTEADPDTDGTEGYPARRSFLIVHPWDLLRANEQHVADLVADVIDGGVHASAVIEGVIRVGAGTRILPGVYIEGNVIIGANCKIGPNCYLRGNTSIGDGCHIGQSVEIKNSLILARTNVGHLSYVGDSVLGEKVNLGAGTTTSNLRHDGANHRSMVDGGLVDTGRRKFGAIVGDGVHTGINTSIYPGRKLWPGVSTRPGEIVQRDVCE